MGAGLGIARNVSRLETELVTLGPMLPRPCWSRGHIFWGSALCGISGTFPGFTESEMGSGQHFGQRFCPGVGGCAEG